ncbi:hypothetical protein CEXT_330101 [Caerostris extrusa]|uniref:Lysosome-associated membrane glycoprotein 2-like transmembrane domain-containing protein n=1 Tax=Caerostris extrusa TaxID=172846 RepID=A0AAV4MSS7_CAEEX|nr:hypothetical protein CEXT_330101 [Caerostris extrusa]
MLLWKYIIFVFNLLALLKTRTLGTAEECEADNKVNDIVPIAVGIALLALVVVVLIAYFVGRRRSRQKGYQSV